MDSAAITLIVFALEKCAKRPKRLPLYRVYMSIQKDALVLVGGTAAIRVQEVGSGIKSSVRFENTDLVISMSYTWASPEHTVIRETIEVAMKSPSEKRQIVFELDAVVTIDGRPVKEVGFFQEFYAEKIRRYIHGNEEASIILGIGWKPPSARDWRNR